MTTQVSENLSLLKYFEYRHLPLGLQNVSKKFHDLANEMNELHSNGQLDSREANAGIRKLLEAKDCFVRANLK